jgi:glycosyltransferase involved in cell wall biosynthesis
MRIVIVDTEMSGDLIGGAQLFLPGLMKGLIERGHDVHCVARGEINERVRGKIEATGVKIHWDIWARSMLVDDADSIFAEWINKVGPDVFLISTSADMGWVVLPMLDSSIATICIGHSNSDGYYLPAGHYRKFLTGAVGVSEEICLQYREKCSIRPEYTQWIPYGVTPSSEEPKDEGNDAALRLVYVGRLAEPDKKVSDLIRIVERLRSSRIAYSLKVIGDGPMMPAFQSELNAEIAAGTLEMLGWVDNAVLLEHLRSSDVSLLVSESEGFCIALVEAMANGCCPIVTDIDSGNKQLVENGVNGFVVPVGDVGGFVDKIELLAADRGRLTEMRKAAWYTGRQYGIDRMVEDYLSCFERAVEDARANPRTPDPNFPLMESCRSKYPLWLRRLKAKASAIFA